MTKMTSALCSVFLSAGFVVGAPAIVQAEVQRSFNFTSENAAEKTQRVRRSFIAASTAKSKTALRKAKVTSSSSRSERKRRYLSIARRVKPAHVPLNLVDAVIQMESGYRPHVIGAAGEVGLMQIKPATADLVRRKFKIKAKSLKDPEHNIRVGTALLGHCHKKAKGDIGATIGCYNAGEGNMWRWQKFAVTRKYVRFVRQQIAQR